MPVARRAPLLALAALLATACGDPAAPVAGEVLGVTIDSSAGPLVRVVTVQLDRPAPAEVTYGAPGTPVLTMGADSLSAEHRFVLPRLRADRDYQLKAAIPRGTTPAVTSTFGTGSLPPEIAELQLQTTGEPSLPVALIEVVGGTRFTGLLIVEDGEVVGYLRMASSLFGATRRANGDVVLLDGELGLVVRRLDGTVAYRLPQPESVAGAAYGPIHHDVVASPTTLCPATVRVSLAMKRSVFVGEATTSWWMGP